jgi:exodeoxyribonuclease VII small subunit
VAGFLEKVGHPNHCEVRRLAQTYEEVLGFYSCVFVFLRVTSWKAFFLKGITMSKKKSEQFEEALKRLQTIVEKLERGDLPLEQAMESFTEGMQLVQLCHQKLEEAERKVQVLVKDQKGAWTAAVFETASKESTEDSH